MNQMNLVPFDFNLVRVFLVIWNARSLTVAGDKLGLTQPAISHALKRLRERFNDPLFVRSGNSMLPTDAAVQLHGPLQAGYDLISEAIQDHAAFVPAGSDRTFRIAMSDISEVFFLPRLLERLQTVAPRVRMEVIPLAVDNVAAILRSGEIDLAVGHLPELDGQSFSRTLLKDRLVCLVRAAHPLAAKGLTVENFSSLKLIHAGVSAPGHQMVEHRLAELGLSRDIAIRVGHLVNAPNLVLATQLGVIFPESLAIRINVEREFSLLPLPFEVPDIEVKLHTHPRFASDRGIQWLTGAVASLFTADHDCA